MMATIFYFLIALIILVVVHEYGHFIVARWCGVKVLRFSFGFGKIIGRWHDKKGTEYVVSLVPLGGYVKMLDESEGEVSPEELHLAFNRQSLLKRTAIVIAGPLFNFIFAFFALWLVMIIGIKSLAPIIEQVKPNSIAAHAGLQPKQEIIYFADKPIFSWRDFQYAIMPLLGSGDSIPLRVKLGDSKIQKNLILPLANWQIDSKNPDLLASLGIEPFIPVIPARVGSTLENSPAQQSGLLANDLILSVDDKTIKNWHELVNYVKDKPETKIRLVIERQGKSQRIDLITGSIIKDNKKQGILGILSQKVDWPPQWLRLQKENPIQAARTAFFQTIDLSAASFRFIGRLIMGKLDIHSLSGPVGIAQAAGQSGKGGISYYLSFLALVSISLGVLNLLPIPMLDGGHLLYHLIELIKGKPVSEEMKTVGAYVGIFFLAIVMVLALSNDLSRLI